MMSTFVANKDTCNVAVTFNLILYLTWMQSTAIITVRVGKTHTREIDKKNFKFCGLTLFNVIYLDSLFLKYLDS